MALAAQSASGLQQSVYNDTDAHSSRAWGDAWGRCCGAAAPLQQQLVTAGAVMLQALVQGAAGRHALLPPSPLPSSSSVPP